MCQAIVFSVLISGLSAFVLTTSDVTELNTCLLKYGRKVMRGRGCKQIRHSGFANHVKHEKMTNGKIHAFLGIASIEVELCSLRVRWYQQMARHPLDHDQILTAIFGSFPFDTPG